MKILFAASEAVPFIKSGGLADVVGSLSRAIRNRGHACRVVLPLYDDIPSDLRKSMKFVTSFRTTLAWRDQYCGVFQSTVNGVIYYLIDNEYYFKRSGIYGFYDDAERFAFFSRAVLDLINHLDFEPDVIHCHDWQTAMVPVYLDVFYRGAEKLSKVKTVFTIHNIQYQGSFESQVSGDVLGLPECSRSIVEYCGDVNFMKGAIEQCDALTTVSPTYAEELFDPWFAHGLDPLIREKSYKLRGILNGIDLKVYDPQKAPYPLPEGKLKCKAELREQLGLHADPCAMLIGMVTRLVSHKGLDLLQEALPRLMELPLQLAVLGTGDFRYEQFLREASLQYPGRVAAQLGFDGALAEKIYIGADLFLMPSRSEPCGLAQMIAMRYGTFPLVRVTGGLRDTVRDFGGEDGNGYNFLSYDSDDMLFAVKRALEDYRNPELWQEHIVAAMDCDFSWSRSAGEYLALYKELYNTIDS